jgi:hypothetical protein
MTRASTPRDLVDINLILHTSPRTSKFLLVRQGRARDNPISISSHTKILIGLL